MGVVVVVVGGGGVDVGGCPWFVSFIVHKAGVPQTERLKWKLHRCLGKEATAHL